MAFAEFSAAWYTPKKMAKLSKIVGTITWMGALLFFRSQ